MRNNQKIKVSCKERKNFLKKMTHLLEIYELIDISSASEDETEALERSSTPLPSGSLPNIGVILNVSNSSARAVADEEEYFDVSADSLEADCKRMRLSSSFESLESGELNNASPKSEYSSMKESPDSPDEQEEDDNKSNPEVFVVEGHRAPSPQSITSCIINEYLEEIHREEDNISLFETPPGPLKRVIPRPISPLNDLEKQAAIRSAAVKRTPGDDKENNQYQPFQFRQPGRVIRPMTVALSQSAPGMDCGCRRIGFGRGHGCTAKLSKRYFGY